ncbi:Uncharacterised protein [Candidatus Tiddalikarchaeum anstoanum]|nr:Uncharacterised protein [Candidatus Tiddalikarchaeum anstoanum]
MTKIEKEKTSTNTQPVIQAKTPPTETKNSSPTTLREDLVKELQKLFNERKQKEKSES